MKSVKILNVKRGKKQTYDITVSDNHNFFCNGHLIHNCGYDGEVKVIIYNTNAQEYHIKKGQKIAQGVLCPVMSGSRVTLHEVVELNSKERGDNGFGSTGI